MADNSLESDMPSSRKMKREREPSSSDTCSFGSSTFEDDDLSLPDLDKVVEECDNNLTKKSDLDFLTQNLDELTKGKCQEIEMRSSLEDSFSSVSSSSSRFSPVLSLKCEEDDNMIKEIATDCQALKSYERGLSTIFRDARFFLMKSCNEENVAVSKEKGVWTTFVANESRLNEAFDQCQNVILIFSVNGSGKFSGFARLASKSSKRKRSGNAMEDDDVNWIFPVGSSQRRMGGIFKLDWISKSELPFTETNHLRNPWNERKLVKIGRDGIEIQPKVGALLCRLFPFDPKNELEMALNRKRTNPVEKGTHDSLPVAAFPKSTRPSFNKARDYGKIKRHYDGERRRQPWHSDSRPFRAFNNAGGDHNSLRPERVSMEHGQPYGNRDYYSPSFPDHDHHIMMVPGVPPVPPFLHQPPAPFDYFTVPPEGPPSRYHPDRDYSWSNESNVHSRMGLRTRFKIRR